LVEFVEFGLEVVFVGEFGLVFGDERGGEGAAEGVFDYFGVFRRAEEHADAGAFVGFFVVAVKGFKLEFEFAKVLGLEFVGFQLEIDEAVEGAVEEEEVEAKIASADLDEVFASDVTEVASEFDEELAELLNEGAVEVAFVVGLREVEEVEEVGVLKYACGIGIQLSHQWCDFWRGEDGALEEGAGELAFEFAFAPFFAGGEFEVEGAFFGVFAA
jgi:hypothetical protein